VIPTARIELAPPVLEETGRAEITDLWLEPAWRGRGLGRALAGAALAWIGARGVHRTEVRAASGNDAGRAFWRALGFAPFVDVLDLRR
jgi:ribosomal protein S18 acetylase RimI-like enzyme